MKQHARPLLRAQEHTAFEGLQRSTFYQLQSFFGGGDYRNNPHTTGGRIVMLATSLSILLVISIFTAEMTSSMIREDQNSGAFETIDDVAAAGARLCGYQSNKESFVQRYPKMASLYQVVETTDLAMAGMDSGLCKVAAVTMDEWDIRQKQASNCDKVLLEPVLMSQSNAFPVRTDLQGPLSYAMTRLQNKGASPAGSPFPRFESGRRV
jgi:hypothetical protein